MHMYSARKNFRENRAIARILKGQMRFATETRLAGSAQNFSQAALNCRMQSLRSVPQTCAADR